MSRDQMVPIKFIAQIVSGGTPKGDPANWNGDIPFITPPDLNGLDGAVLRSWGRTITQAGQLQSTVVRDAVMLSCRAPIGHIGTATQNVAFNQGCKAIITERPEDLRFLAYCLVAHRTALQVAGRGTTFLELSTTDLAAIAMPWPTPAERERISDYLDREAGGIDAMLAKMDELTETLEVRRTAVIDHELSSYLLAPLESGWTVTDCMHKTATFVDEGEYLVVSIGQLDGVHVDTTTSPRTTEEEFAYLRSGGRTPKPGDAIMSRNASVGKLALVTPETPAFALGQDVVLLSPFKNEDARLLAYVMGATRTREALDLMMQGTTFKRINVASIRKLPWVHLSGDEQTRIADHLDAVTSKIDQMLAKTAELKSLLIERRSALITDVVTGEKRVHS